jgi:hypothetical protein
MVDMIPSIIVKSDYDGYFEGLVKHWVNEKAKNGGTFTCVKIEVSAGPYRAAAVSYERKESGRVLALDFYSAIRRGFGSLSEQDVIDIQELM